MITNELATSAVCVAGRNDRLGTRAQRASPGAVKSRASAGIERCARPGDQARKQDVGDGEPGDRNNERMSRTWVGRGLTIYAASAEGGAAEAAMATEIIDHPGAFPSPIVRTTEIVSRIATNCYGAALTCGARGRTSRFDSRQTHERGQIRQSATSRQASAPRMSDEVHRTTGGESRLRTK